MVELFQRREERCDVLGPKDKAVNVFSGEVDAVKSVVVGVSAKAKPGGKPSTKPISVARRYVGPIACGDNHADPILIGCSVMREQDAPGTLPQVTMCPLDCVSKLTVAG